MSKVLVVDDDRTMVSLLRTLLELDGYEVALAGTAQSFWEQLDEHQPDLILLDVHLQDQDGFELVKTLRNRSDTSVAQTPVIMTSGMEVSSKSRDAGADAFLLKPYDPEQLLDRIRSYLGEG